MDEQEPLASSPQPPSGSEWLPASGGAPRSPSCPTCSVGRLPASSCPTCGGGGERPPRSTPFVYAVGRVAPRFPSPSIEKELAQAIGRAETIQLTDRQAIHCVLSERRNRYIARQLCWAFAVQGLDTYLLQPRNPDDIDLLIEAIRPTPEAEALDIVIGVLAGNAPPEMCNGLTLPVVVFDQLYSFDRASFLDSIPRPQGTEERGFKSAAEETFARILQMTGNAGATNEHRALNYLAARYPALYGAVAAAFARDAALSAVEVRRAPVGQPRMVVDAVFSFTDRKTDVVSKQSVRVDVTEEFPFLVAKLSPYFDH